METGGVKSTAIEKLMDLKVVVVVCQKTTLTETETRYNNGTTENKPLACCSYFNIWV